MAIQVKTLDQLKTMRRAGLVVAEIHKAIREAIKPGMTTSALDTIAEAVIKRNGATSNFKGITDFQQQSAFQSMMRSCTAFLEIESSTMAM